jgi:hypothetical protein
VSDTVQPALGMRVIVNYDEENECWPAIRETLNDRYHRDESVGCSIGGDTFSCRIMSYRHSLDTRPPWSEFTLVANRQPPE